MRALDRRAHYRYVLVSTAATRCFKPLLSKRYVEESYMEEDTTTYLPTDNRFCEVMDASIKKAVALASLEKTLLQYVERCIKPLPEREDDQGPSPL
ncbi:hypothetical protein NDU88_009676 [Pleurodeles waltl]|uniref:Uncharacterized protein n=1 Tax=Pleurodeles waltl TaxID=8319 RepID=A0AAV7PTX1_PLEWA|nr:hypothetical protein NDU88_009676 [Pleurodeles waltl]